MKLIMTTCAEKGDAETLARKLVEGRLAACVQILSPMTSVYHWEGTIAVEQEYLMFIKTTDERYAEVESFLLKEHPYETPEIAAFDADRVAAGYNAWLNETVSR